MTKRDKLRRLTHLMYNHIMPYHVVIGWIDDNPKFSLEAFIKGKNIILEEIKKEVYSTPNKYFTQIYEKVELYKLADELKISDEELMKLWFTQQSKRSKNRDEYRKKPIRVRKDNGNVHNFGSGNSNGYSIRYPSKKRSIRVWKKFYKLFPYAAIADEWNGKTSKRMK